ncbi:hypothetical protein C8J57DRAFT_1527788 [Mycena rebaudengoi]|nr:hypothetical protein C8J57DRAFT_1527788 [Mycena rebaudengoi]
MPKPWSYTSRRPPLSIARARNDAETWDVVITTDGSEHRFKVKHVVFATGLGAGEGKLPTYPGMVQFALFGGYDRTYSKARCSTRHKRATDHAGKKVVVIGACTSAHDIAMNYYEQGVDITMYQRSSSYVLSTKNGWTRESCGQFIGREGPPPSSRTASTHRFRT